MRAQDLIIEVRDSSLNRVGQITDEYKVGLEAVLRFRAVGAWKITLPTSHPMAEALRAPGAGIIITGDSGVLMSGPTRSAKSVKTDENPEGTWEISGVDDNAILGERIAYPTPDTDDIAAQGDYDVRTGPAETVIKGYVNANLGPSAPTARRVPGLTIQADNATGETVTGRARFDTLGALASQLAVTSNLGFRVIQDGSNLEFQTYQPIDRSAEVRMDIDNYRLTKSEYAYTAPEATRVIVAGQGTGADRTLIERATTDSQQAETAWGRRIEVFKDQRNTNDTVELQQAGDEILAEKGITVESVSVTPTDDSSMDYPSDWGLGDKVSVVVGEDTISQIVTEVAIVITDEGVKIGATVGDPTVSDDVEAQVINQQSSQEARISNLERNETGSSSGGSAFGNLDGGLPNTNFGGGEPIDAGGV